MACRLCGRLFWPQWSRGASLAPCPLPPRRQPTVWLPLFECGPALRAAQVARQRGPGALGRTQQGAPSPLAKRASASTSDLQVQSYRESEVRRYFSCRVARILLSVTRFAPRRPRGIRRRLPWCRDFGTCCWWFEVPPDLAVARLERRSLARRMPVEWARSIDGRSRPFPLAKRGS